MTLEKRAIYLASGFIYFFSLFIRALIL